MKRILALLLSISILFCLVACKKRPAGSADSVLGSTASTETRGSTPATETTGGKETTGTEATQGATAPGETTAPTVPSATGPADSTDPTNPTGAPSTEATQPTQPGQPPHSHSYSSRITKAATCTGQGVRTFSCACGASYTESIPATGHSWGQWVTTKEPTIAAEGNSQRKCDNCSATENKPISKLPDPGADSGPVTQAQLQQIHDLFLTYVNAERVRVGVSPLSTNTHLSGWAQTRSQETITLFSHTRPDGQPWSTIIDGSQYPWVTIGENLCMTSHMGDNPYTSADKWVGSQSQIEAAAGWLFNLLKNSPGHYANMINGSFTECGIGISYQMEGSIQIPMFYLAHIFGAR